MIDKNKIVSVLLRMMLIMVCFVCSMLSQRSNTDTVVLICVVFYALLCLASNIPFVLKYTAFLAGAGLAIIGTYIIESSDIWLGELRKYSYHVGAFPLISAYYLLFLFSLELFNEHYSRKKKRGGRIVVISGHANWITSVLDIAEYLVFLVTVIMTARLFPHFAILEKLDRFGYRARYIHGIWERIANYYIYFIPFLLINWDRHKHRLITILTLSMYVLYLFMQGEKFGNYSVLLLFCMMYAVSYVHINQETKKTWKRMIRVVVGVIIASFGVVMLQYTLFPSSTSALEHLKERLAQQGQLWWSIYSIQRGESPKIEEISDELEVYDTENKNGSEPYYGIYKVMYLSAPRSVVTSKISTGSTYTESTAASLYYYFGASALPIFALIMGWYFSFLAYKYADYIRRRCIIEALIVTRLILLSRPFFSNSAFSFLFGADTVFTVILVLMCAIIRHLYGTAKPSPCELIIVSERLN